MHTDKKPFEIRQMLISTFFLWFSVYTYPSFLSVYAGTELGATPVMVGLIVGSYGFTQMVLRIPLGIFSDIVQRRKPFMVMGMGVSILSAVGLIVIKHPVGVLLCRGLAGVTASTWVSYSVMYSSRFAPGELTPAMGRLSTTQYGSQLLAMLAGGYLAQWLSKDAAFALAAAGGIAGLIAVLPIRDIKPTAPPQTLKSLLSVGKNRSLLISTGLMTLMQFISWGTVLGFTANWARDSIGLDMGQLGLLSAMYLLPNTVLPRLTTGPLTRRFGESRVLAAGFLLLGTACALFGHTGHIVTLFLTQALYGVGMSMIGPINMAGAISDIPDEKRGAAMGFYQSVYGVGMFLGPLTAGAVIQWFSTGADLTRGYQANFVMMAALALLGAVLSLCSAPRKRKER